MNSAAVGSKMLKCVRCATQQIQNTKISKQKTSSEIRTLSNKKKNYEHNTSQCTHTHTHQPIEVSKKIYEVHVDRRAKKQQRREEARNK